jgi:hypothetical protein
LYARRCKLCVTDELQGPGLLSWAFYFDVYGAPCPVADEVRDAVLVGLHELDDIPPIRLEQVNDAALDFRFEHRKM